MRYNPSLKRSEKYEPTYKMKINLSGKGEIKCWDEDKKPRPQPENWLACSVAPKVVLTSLWIMGSGKEFGCLFSCTDCLVHETPQECPF